MVTMCGVCGKIVDPNDLATTGCEHIKHYYYLQRLETKAKQIRDALTEALKNSQGGFETYEFYKPLIEAGLLSEDCEEICGDSFYDSDAVRFALTVVNKILD